jgi:hypothetical protein
MKRTITAVAVLALLVVAACATAPTTPSVQGTITAVEGNNVTITPAGGQPVSLSLGRTTVMSWYTGVDATRSDLQTGRRVSVWTPEGSQTVSRLVIER